VRQSKIVPDPKKRKRKVKEPVTLYLVNTDHFKEFIHGHMRIQAGDPGEWRLHNNVDADYRQQLLSESQVSVENKHGLVETRYVVIDKAAGNHYADAEAYAAAAAWFPLRVQRYVEPEEDASGQKWFANQVRK
jgi:phage terminase large subunit GpA-like protein